MTIAACPMPRTAITTAPSPTTTRPSVCSRRPILDRPRRCLQSQGRLRPRHCRLRSRRRADPGFASPTTIAVPPIAKRVISTMPSPIISKRCASIRSSTRPPKISPPCARSATGSATNSDRLLPSFDAAAASRAVEKAICSDPDLTRLDREIDAAYKAALAAGDNKTATQLRQQQRDFIRRTQ